ncbi:MAG: hypothetical protein R3B54_10210 [Bdellovibrionota bacterium]
MNALKVGIVFGAFLVTLMAKADPPLLAKCSEEKKNDDGSITILSPRVSAEQKP